MAGMMSSVPPVATKALTNTHLIAERTGNNIDCLPGAWSTFPIGGVDGGTVQATPVLLCTKILFGNLRVNLCVRRGPAEQSAEQNHSGRCN